MAPHLISVVIPTLGRPTLRDTILSIPEDEDIQVIVVADGAEAHEKALQAITGIGRPILACCNIDWSDTVGHEQRMRGMGLADGKWLSFMDDDDVYTEDAFPAFREVADTLGPHIFRMRFPNGEVYPFGERMIRGNVGTPMLFCRNENLGAWKPERTGDFDFIESTCQKQGQPVWHETIVCQVRPQECE